MGEFCRGLREKLGGWVPFLCVQELTPRPDGEASELVRSLSLSLKNHPTHPTVHNLASVLQVVPTLML